MISQINKIILKSLSTGDKYGLEIIKDIEIFTKGRVVLKQPSLYSALRRMEKKGYISSFWQDSELGGRRHYYSLSNSGRAELKKDEFISDADIESILLEAKKSNANENKVVSEPVVKKKSTYEKFDPTFSNSSNQSFSQQMRKSSEREVLEEKTIPAPTKLSEKNDTIESPSNSSFWRDSMKNDQVSSEIKTEFKLDEEAPKSNKYEINYKDILGELDADKPVSKEPEIYSTPSQKGQERRVQEQNSQQKVNYTKQVSDIFSSNNTASNYKAQKESDLRDAILKQQTQSTLDEINRRYNLGGANNSKQIDNNLSYNKIKPDEIEVKEYTKNDATISSGQKDFLNINKLNLTRSIIMTCLFIASVLISYFVFNDQAFVYGPHAFVYWLAIGLAVVYLCIMMVLTIPQLTKKVQIKKLNWPVNLFYRTLLVVALFTFVIAMCLCFGMNNLLQIEFFTLWYIPTLAIAGLWVSWLVGLIIYSTKAFRE